MDLQTMHLNANNCELIIDSPMGRLLQIRLEFLEDIIAFTVDNTVLDFVYNPLITSDDGTMVRSTEVRRYKLLLSRMD